VLVRHAYQRYCETELYAGPQGHTSREEP